MRRKSKVGTRRCFHARFRSVPGRARDYGSLRSRRDSRFRMDTQRRNLDVKVYFMVEKNTLVALQTLTVTVSRLAIRETRNVLVAAFF